MHKFESDNLKNEKLALCISSNNHKFLTLTEAKEEFLIKIRCNLNSMTVNIVTDNKLDIRDINEESANKPSHTETDPLLMDI